MLIAYGSAISWIGDKSINNRGDKNTLNLRLSNGLIGDGIPYFLFLGE